MKGVRVGVSVGGWMGGGGSLDCSWVCVDRV